MRTLETINKYLASRNWRFVEVLVVDDGSSDGTVDLVERFRTTAPMVQVLRSPVNRGKGYAVRRGMLQARGQWVLYTDADLSTPIEELDALLATAQTVGASVVIASRALNRALVEVHQPMFRELAGRMFNAVMRLITRLPFSDTQCGFKLYNATAAHQIFQSQRLDGFGFDVENLLIAKLLGFRAIELPVRWSDRPGTKVSFLKGLKSFLELLQIRYWQFSGQYGLKHETAMPNNSCSIQEV